MGRLGLAFRCFFRVLSGKPLPLEALPEELQPARLLPQARAEHAADGTAQAVQLLALLQKEGRLLDFLQEDIDSCSDAQVGAAVRNIHHDCRQVLAEHVSLAPVLDSAEESQVMVEADFDPSRIRLIGNVTGQPPFRGVLKHHGWQVTNLKLPALADGHDASVIAPAEVELP